MSDTDYKTQNAGGIRSELFHHLMRVTVIFRDDIAEILGHKELTVVNNILPSLDSPNPFDARKAICDIF